MSATKTPKQMPLQSTLRLVDASGATVAHLTFEPSGPDTVEVRGWSRSAGWWTRAFRTRAEARKLARAALDRAKALGGRVEWAHSAETIEQQWVRDNEDERRMQEQEEAGDRAGTARDEANKARARRRLECTL